ncbi:MAG TPA: MBL fold metallo-hydrolase [Microvirga sp.]|nr:MBL fold metallo-hydrolase [Microvirga sp.]
MIPTEALNLSRRGVLLGGGAMLAGAAFLDPAPVRAAAPPLGTQVPGWYRFKLGEFECTVVSDGPLAPSPVQAVYPPLMEDEFSQRLAENFLPAKVPFDQNALVVNTGRQLVLFDTGVGTIKALGPNAGRLLGNLKAAGIEPAQIDAVVITHAHSDHCWALMAGDQPNFPNAKVFIARADFEFWTDENKMGSDMMKLIVPITRGQLLPLRDRVTFVEDGQEVLPGITAMSTPGHTVGHTSFVIGSGPSSLMLVGDVVHNHILSLERPRFPMAFDSDGGDAIKSRLRVLDMLAANRMPLIAYHFPFPGIGNVSKAGDGYRWHPAPWQVVI